MWYTETASLPHVDKYYTPIVERIITVLNNKISNRSCKILPLVFNLSSVPTITIVYQGSTDPGTVKSKYPPTISNIMEIIQSRYKVSWSFAFSGHGFTKRRKNVRVAQYPDIDAELSSDLEWSMWTNSFSITIPIVSGGVNSVSDQSDESEDIIDTFEVSIDYYFPTIIERYIDKE